MQVQNGIIMSGLGEIMFIMLDKQKELDLNVGHISSLDNCLTSIAGALREIQVDTGMRTEEEMKQDDEAMDGILNMILDLFK